MTPPNRRRTKLVAGVAALVLAAVCGTAAVTYAVARRGLTATPVVAAAPTSSTQPPQFSAADQMAAKQRVCRLFDVSTRGGGAGGGVVRQGQVNVPMVLRVVNSVVAVKKALTPATPPDVAAAAHRYVDANLDLTTAAMGSPLADDLNRLNDTANAAMDGLADACGLSH